MGGQACERTAGGPGGRVGILGGTFDPIHNGHLAVAEAAARACHLDRVILMPAGDPAFKQGDVWASAQDRLAMCRLAAEESELFDVSALEVEREGVTYTVDTLRELREGPLRDAEILFILGADAALTLPQWHGAEELGTLARFVAVSRPGHALDPAAIDRLRADGFDILPLEGVHIDISSSEVRRRCSEGRSIEDLVPSKVTDHIRARGLYGASSAS